MGQGLYEANNGCVFTMCMDIDNLKEINDRFGHTYGDKAIVALADAIKTVFTDDEIRVRMGGDEFTVIGRCIPESGLKDKEDRIHKYLADFTESNDFPADVEASIAYAFNDETEDPIDMEKLVHLADQRMYEIKKEHHRRRKANA